MPIYSHSQLSTYEQRWPKCEFCSRDKIGGHQDPLLLHPCLRRDPTTVQDVQSPLQDGVTNTWAPTGRGIATNGCTKLCPTRVRTTMQKGQKRVS